MERLLDLHIPQTFGMLAVTLFQVSVEGARRIGRNGFVPPRGDGEEGRGEEPVDLQMGARGAAVSATRA